MTGSERLFLIVFVVVTFADAIEAALNASKASARNTIRHTRRVAIVAAHEADDGWRPIETAPKGIEIMLYEPEVSDSRNYLEARIVVSRYPTHYPRQATHWRPLPPPPTDET